MHNSISPPRFATLQCALALVTTLALMGSHAAAHGPGKASDFQGRRVLLIGIDGCRRDVMQQVTQDGSAPHLTRLANEGHACWNMEAGGQIIGTLNQPTISGPGWSTLFTGVFASKHGVLGNGDKFTAGHFTQFPHYFRYLREAKPQAWLGSIVGDTWPEVNSILLTGSGEKLANDTTIVSHEIVMEGEKARKLNDANVAKEAVRCLSQENPDVLFLHFLDVDHAGHQFGFSTAIPQYVSTLQQLDKYIGTVMAALQARPQFKDESWLVIVMTDHGGLERKHGGQSPEERQIFAFFHQPGFKPTADREGKVYQSLVTPTVLNYLQIPIKPEWGFESEPLKVAE
ncbi:MAG: alkaline phosphatase family protein [Verrucomicrobiota bacterium]